MLQVKYKDLQIRLLQATFNHTKGEDKNVLSDPELN